MLDLSPLDRVIGWEVSLFAAVALVLLGITIYLMIRVGRKAALAGASATIVITVVGIAAWAWPATVEARHERDGVVDAAKESIKDDILHDYNVEALRPAEGEWDASFVKLASEADFSHAPLVDVLLTDGRWVTYALQFDPRTSNARLIADARQRVIIPAELERTSEPAAADTNRTAEPSPSATDSDVTPSPSQNPTASGTALTTPPAVR